MQGKFHEKCTIVYENQQQWSTVDKPAEVFDKYAKDIGLDVAKFKDDVTSDAVSRRLGRSTER